MDGETNGGKEATQGSQDASQQQGQEQQETQQGQSQVGVLDGGDWRARGQRHG